MSWAELFTPGRPTVRESALESQRFGLRVERLVVPRTADAGTDEILELVASSAADVVVARYPAERVELFAELLASGRTPLLADSLVYWELRVGTGRRPRPAADLTVDVRSLDAGSVGDVVDEVFSGYRNHYLANPLFDARLARDGYREWARRSASATAPVVVTRGADVIAFATVATAGATLEIELAGVVPREQRRGVYAHLLAGVEDVAADAGRDRVVISTQGHNTNVQRAWARYGFEPVATFLTVHVLREPLRPS